MWWPSATNRKDRFGSAGWARDSVTPSSRAFSGVARGVRVRSLTQGARYAVGSSTGGSGRRLGRDRKGNLGHVRARRTSHPYHRPLGWGKRLARAGGPPPEEAAGFVVSIAGGPSETLQYENVPLMNRRRHLPSHRNRVAATSAPAALPVPPGNVRSRRRYVCSRRRGPRPPTRALTMRKQVRPVGTPSRAMRAGVSSSRRG